MNEYHKIETVWKRDPATKHKTLLAGEWSRPEFDYLKNAQWWWDEKVDGTNIRIMWDGVDVRFGGKTDRAQIPAHLVEHLMEHFTRDALAAVFGLNGNRESRVCLYGEGYGARIQKGGGNYNPDGASFCLFDVRVGDIWLTRESVRDVAENLPDYADHHKVVPWFGRGSLLEAIEEVQNARTFPSAWGDFEAEGLVLRPLVELADRQGGRIITKVKRKDFA